MPLTSNGRRRLRRFALSTVMAIAVATGAGFLLGPVAAVVAGVVAGVVGFLGVAIYSDDNLGTCLPLAVFFLIGLTLLLIAFVATIEVNT